MTFGFSKTGTASRGSRLQPGVRAKLSRAQGLHARRCRGSIQSVMLGIFCILFLVAGITARWLPFLDQAGSEFASGMLLKLAVVLLVAWLAAPQLEKLGWQRLRGSALVGLLIVAVAFAIRPRLGAIVGIAFLAAAIFFGVVGWLRKKSGTLR